MNGWQAGGWKWVGDKTEILIETGKEGGRERNVT